MVTGDWGRAPLKTSALSHVSLLFEEVFQHELELEPIQQTLPSKDVPVLLEHFLNYRPN